MKSLAIFLIIISLLLLCGCTGYREIDRGYLVTAIGFGQTDEGFSIIIEAMSSSDVSDKKSERETLSGKGKTVDEAFNTLQNGLVKPLYFEHLGAVVIENSLSQKNTEQTLEFCKDLQSVSLGLYVVATPDLRSLFEFESPNGVLGYDIIGLIKNFEKHQSKSFSNRLFELQRQNQTNFSLPFIDIKTDKLNLTVAGK